MNRIAIIIFLIFPLIGCSEYTLDNCLLHSRNHKKIIDFSGKLENDDWGTVESQENLVNASYYFSLCPGNLSKCPSKSFFCLKLNDGTVLDLGSTFIETTEEKLENTDVLFNMTLKGEYGSGLVHIHCDQSRSDPILHEVQNINPKGRPFYNYLINWRSVTNCPIKQFLAEDSCILYTNTRSYDLRPLQSSYEVTRPGTGTQYIINLCEIEDKTKCPSYVCEVRNGKPQPVSSSFELKHLEQKGLSFNFVTNSGEKIIIYLDCSSSQEKQLSFVSDDGYNIVFFFKTPFVCKSSKMDCLLLPQENLAYDLSPLQKIIDNYELIFNDEKKILLNFCGPLNYAHHLSCADGNRNFGCLVDKDYKILALATEVNNVTVVKEGQISLLYRGNGENSLSLSVMLKCGKNRSYPVIHAINSHNYDITWETNFACPLKYSVGKHCVVENLYNKSKINLMPLFKKESDYHVVNGQESFRINVCGKLNKSCQKNPEAAVCYKTADGKEIAIGETGSLEPTFVDGQFLFNLKGEPCHRNATISRVKIIMGCEFSDGISNHSPELFHSSEEHDCIFHFYWKTPLICTPSATSKCIYSDNNVKYDLSSLRNLRDNYVINFNDSQIELNVCHSLVSGHRTQCHDRSGACLKNNSIESILVAAHQNHENTVNLGLVSEHDEFEVIDNKIRLCYKNGEVCMTGKDSTYSTTIDFICNKTASNTEPKFIGVNDCNYNFTWITSAACPTYKKKSLCTAIDPVSKKKFNLTSLMGHDVLVEGTKIVLGICHPVGMKGCPENSGACMMRNNSYQNIGNYNSQLQYANKSLFLVYEASQCKSTRIEFRCSDTMDSKPIFIRETNCSTYILWPTSLACLNDNAILNCCQGVENLCEKLTGTYEVALNKKEKIFINICRPLLPKVGLLCPPQSASCLASNKSQDTLFSEKSLGSAVLRPQFLNESAVVLKYFDGSICHEESDSKYSTSITFVCDRNATNGHPELINISDDCQYEFKWATSLMCSEKCTFHKENKNFNFLRQFLDSDKRIAASQNGGRSPYILNLCKVSEKCGSNICRMASSTKWERFATMNNSHVPKIADTETEIFYTYLKNTSKKDTCGAKVDLICDINDSGPGRPYLQEETDCFIHVIWKSNLACLTEKSSVSSSNFGAWMLFAIGIIAFVGILVVLVQLNTRKNLIYINLGFGNRRPSLLTELTELASEGVMDDEELALIKNV